MLFPSSSAPLALVCLTFTGTVHANELAPRQDSALPTCVQACHDIVLPIFNCDSPTKLCFCTEPGVTSLIDACAASNCTYGEQLESQKFQATTCEIPGRNNANTLIQLSWAMLGLTTLFFLARSAARLLTHSGLHKDDWTMISSYLPLIGATICIHIAATADGFGQDSYNLTIFQISSFLKVYYAFIILSHSILLTTKLTLIFIYLRILPRESLSQAYISLCWTFIALLLTTFLATELATVLQCMPIASTWNFVFGEHGQCLDITTLFRAISALDVVYDMVLIFLPIPPLLAISRNMSLGQKAGVYGTYSVGVGMIVCTLGKLIPSTTNPGAPLNLTWTLSNVTIWTILEMNLSVIVCCIPALSPLLAFGRRSSSGLSITTSSSAEEILDERDRRRSGLRFNVLEVPEDAKDLNSSPGIHVGVGEKKVAIQHSIPHEATRDKFVYRDGRGEMHEVELFDRPMGSRGGNNSEYGSNTEEKGPGFDVV